MAKFRLGSATLKYGIEGKQPNFSMNGAWTQDQQSASSSGLQPHFTALADSPVRMHGLGVNLLCGPWP
jgi:hypothetical protein